MLGLAVAFIMGVYVGQVVQSLVTDILMSLIGLAIPGLGNLSTFKIAVPLTTFVIVAFVIFLIVKMTKKGYRIALKTPFSYIV